MKEIDLIIFDFDGTLVDSGEDLVNSVNYALKKLHLPTLDKGTVITFVGDGINKLIEKSLGSEYPNKFEDALYFFKEHYQKHMFDNAALYPGVKTVLNHFRLKNKIIMTNKLYEYTYKIAKHLEIDSYFEEIIGADSTEFIKPDPHLLWPFLRKYKAVDDRAIIIGDGINDILLAKNAGILSCAFLNGLTSRNILLNLNPDFFCEELSEMTTLLNDH